MYVPLFYAPPNVCVPAVVQDVCQSAVKELELERKLNQVIGEWNHHSFTLESFKVRGELLLDVDSTLKITSQLEDSLMILTSLNNSRYTTMSTSDYMYTIHFPSTLTAILSYVFKRELS